MTNISQNHIITILIEYISFGNVICIIDEQTFYKYCKVSNIRRTKFQNLNVSHLILQLSFPNPLKPGVKSRMKI